MKTSNKLIILILVLLYVVPLSAMLYTLQYYSDSDAVSIEAGSNDFSKEIEGYEAIPTKKPFKTIHIDGNNTQNFHVNFVKSDVFGIKINSSAKEQFDLSEDTEGNLSFKIKESANDNYIVIMYVYGNGQLDLNVQKANGLDVSGFVAHLKLNVEKVNGLYFNSKAVIDQLDLQLNSVESVKLNAKIGSAGIYAQTSNVDWEVRSAKFLDLTAHDANVQFGDERSDKISVNALKLTTKGNSKLKFNKILYHQISGNLSDSSVVNLPISDLRKLMN